MKKLFLTVVVGTCLSLPVFASMNQDGITVPRKEKIAENTSADEAKDEVKKDEAKQEEVTTVARTEKEPELQRPFHHRGALENSR